MPHARSTQKDTRCCRTPGGFEAVAGFFWKGGNTHFPARAPPAVQKGEFVLCNTPGMRTRTLRLEKEYEGLP